MALGESNYDSRGGGQLRGDKRKSPGRCVSEILTVRCPSAAGCRLRGCDCCHPQGRDLWPGAVLAGFVFSISERHKSNRALITTATIDPLELPGLVAAYASTCRARQEEYRLSRRGIAEKPSSPDTVPLHRAVPRWTYTEIFQIRSPASSSPKLSYIPCR
jgi:hypothetical protein